MSRKKNVLLFFVTIVFSLSLLSRCCLDKIPKQKVEKHLVSKQFYMYLLVGSTITVKCCLEDLRVSMFILS